jgi:hypothetical protein
MDEFSIHDRNDPSRILLTVRRRGNPAYRWIFAETLSPDRLDHHIVVDLAALAGILPLVPIGWEGLGGGDPRCEVLVEVAPIRGAASSGGTSAERRLQRTLRAAAAAAAAFGDDGSGEGCSGGVASGGHLGAAAAVVSFSDDVRAFDDDGLEEDSSGRTARGEASVEEAAPAGGTARVNAAKAGLRSILAALHAVTRNSKDDGLGGAGEIVSGEGASDVVASDEGPRRVRKKKASGVRAGAEDSGGRAPRKVKEVREERGESGDEDPEASGERLGSRRVRVAREVRASRGETGAGGERGSGGVRAARAAKASRERAEGTVAGEGTEGRVENLLRLLRIVDKMDKEGGEEEDGV